MATRVILDGRETPVLFEKTLPKITARELQAFEKKLGFALPADYRAFLLAYNGGRPTVGWVTGRDDDPNTPYAYGDAVSVFFGLGRVPEWARLRAPSEMDWELPPRTLFIAEDAGGNMFALECEGKNLVRFVDHESGDPVSDGRVLAEGFTDLLMRIRTVEEQERLDRIEREEKRRDLADGPLPPAVEEQCRAVEARHPGVRAAIREAFLAVFDHKGYFAVHADDASRAVLDLVAWLGEESGAPFPSSKAVQDALLSSWAAPKGGLGFSGYGPAFIDQWWAARTADGTLDARGRLTPEARDRLSPGTRRAT